MSGRAKLRAGDWVEVRSKEEILRTLDGQGQLEALPFMPEMFRYCGQRFQVFKRAHKTCDPPSGLRARGLANSLHLKDVRCDGDAHGGCQAGCLIFWKDAWVRKVGSSETVAHRPAPSESVANDVPVAATRCSEEQVWAGVHQTGGPVRADEPAYVCQATRLAAATIPLPWWRLRQYAEDLTSGNVGMGQMVAALLFTIYHRLAESGVGMGAAMRWAYDAFQRIRGGAPYPVRTGKVPSGMRTPSLTLGLKSGEVVKVRSYAAILETLDDDWRNRGMYFDVEQVPYCDGRYKVLRRVERIIDEKTGRMTRLRNDAVILEDVACQARYSKCRRFCSRSIYPYWREIWLERV
jgi:hypothetical protein